MLKIFKNANIIDCKDEKNIINGSILVEDEKIKKIGVIDEELLSDDIEIIDCKGNYLMPGMINSHVHIFMEPYTWDRKSMFEETQSSMILNAMRRLDQLLKSGVTYFRDCGGFNLYDIELRDELIEKNWLAPEFLAAGDALCISGGHTWWMSRQCDGENEFIKGVRENIRQGSDFIKIMITGGYARQNMRVNHNLLPGAPQMTLKEIEAVVYEAHRHGKKVATHCIGLEGVKLAVEAGVDSIEHGQFHNPEDKEVDKVIEKMVKKGTYITPTLSAYFKNYEKSEVRKQYKSVEESFKKCYEAGVKIAMATDAGCPFVGHHETALEIKHQIEAGMTPIESIMSATKNAAQLLGIDNEYGTLEEGKYADILVLDDNPIENIDVLLGNKEVYKKGVLVK